MKLGLFLSPFISYSFKGSVIIFYLKDHLMGFLGSPVVENPPSNARDAGLIPGLLQYFWHLMQRTDSLEKTLTLGKIEGGRRG